MKLQKLMDDWKTVMFVTRNHKEKDGVFVLGDIEDMLTLLDEG